MNDSILIIDDEPVFLRSIRRSLMASGFKFIRTESDPVRAAALFQEGSSCAIALIDVAMPVLNGVQLLEQIKNRAPETECIMITAVDDAQTAIRCIKKGAYDYLTKPVSEDELLVTIRNALERQRLRRLVNLGKDPSLLPVERHEAFKTMITQSPNMLRLFKEAELHACSDVPILITGETGVGKELLAKAIHAASERSSYPYIPINMASHASSLFDAEFFGHTKGAFTGAEKFRPGYLEAAHRGTLALDEIGLLPYDLQGRLLRVFQEGEYIKLGEDKPHSIDVRVIAMTNEPLEQRVQQGQFRKDLYYRLKGAWLHVPPLRERPEDIPLLIQAFLKKFTRDRAPLPVQTGLHIDDEAVHALTAYNYPGNIRELLHIIQGAVNLTRNGHITLSDLPQQLQHLHESRTSVPQNPATRDAAALQTLTLLSEVERAHILNIYEHTGSNKAQTAKLLGIALNTLRKKLREYGVN